MSLDLRNAIDSPELLATPVVSALAELDPVLASQISVASIDASLADTAAFCEAYGIRLEDSANCIVVAGRRGDDVTYAACVVLATTRADVNGAVRKLLGVRKVSFAPMDEATALSGMEYGGITPIGLPGEWRVLVDSRVIGVAAAIIGAGIRGAKISLPGSVLAALPGVEVIEDLAKPIQA
ncbi:YbaK/EbsC family protein [Leucobacter sp. UT-8R-CII-1-4]|uniref:YbaK/EbsC family protein n=1 Tax=Leucobacter sp. UT-8R-CII-1-4 TaxID=3040075 RepID=UPI0024A87511|nr:YbaK/EbsC family protein [Leucobacter sp. UT-8R-CII-1-4]MDI6023059.1 YbaK/EbsC family protein [Leucobacter sp. UT-8R-CII-1-4]